MQNCFLASDFSAIEVPESREIVSNVNRLANAFREAGSSVIWTRHSSCKDWKSWCGKILDVKTCDRVIEETRAGSFGHAIADTMDVSDADILIDKERYSALIEEALINLVEFWQHQVFKLEALVLSIVNLWFKSITKKLETWLSPVG